MEHFLGFIVLYSAGESANYLNNETKTQKNNSSTIIVFFQSINVNATHHHTPVKFSKFYKHLIHFFSYPSDETFENIIFQESKHLVITSHYFVFSSHPRMIYRRSFKSRDGTSGNMTWTTVLS